jgi:hypothetical protein
MDFYLGLNELLLYKAHKPFFRFSSRIFHSGVIFQQVQPDHIKMFSHSSMSWLSVKQSRDTFGRSSVLFSFISITCIINQKQNNQNTLEVVLISSKNRQSLEMYLPRINVVFLPFRSVSSDLNRIEIGPGS